MIRKRLVPAVLAALTTLASAVVVYATRVRKDDQPPWLSGWALAHRADLALGLLAIAFLACATDVWRLYVEVRHPAKEVLRKMVEDYASAMFHHDGRRNRVTLFKSTNGWRAFIFGMLKWSALENPYKRRALARIIWRKTYVGVYVRPAAARHSRSATVFRVSDNAPECEGMAGLVWERGYVLLAHLPKIDRDEVRNLTAESFAKLRSDHPIRQYASSTGIRDLRLLKSMDHFARHFLGTVIRRADGTNWGVLLLDSEADDCPFPLDGGHFQQRFDDRARLIGAIIA